MALKIIKASAGSGKTYSLALEYIKLLLSSGRDDAYGRILAVTFTNKAADEMKRRILDELHVLATDTEKSPYLAELVPASVPDAATLRERAAKQLGAILNDYSGFAVSTIDKFFQKVLRSFARESGFSPDYQVELDKGSLLEETVQRILGTLSRDDRKRFAWIVDGIKTDLGFSGRYMLDKRLAAMAEELFSRPDGGHEASTEGLDELRDRCTKIMETFPEKVAETAREVVEAIRLSDIRPEDSNRGFMKGVLPYVSPVHGAPVVPPSAFFLDKAVDPDNWFSKKNSFMLGLSRGYLEEPLARFAELFKDPYREYATAKVLLEQVCSLGLAPLMRKVFTEIQRERNVVTIDDANVAIRNIVKGTDPEFLYEHIAAHYDHILIDEFQDTSVSQWNNFRPLLEAGVSAGKESLVVGDVKQSIYRWRGSDSTLLGETVQRVMNVGEDDVTVLDGNWRTCHKIVEFNNDFFRYMAERIDKLLGVDKVEEAYSDVVQKPRTKDPEPGYVRVRFVDPLVEAETVLDTIRTHRQAGASYGDIAVLVRGNAEGQAIAAMLVDAGIPVMSDEALHVKSSSVVRRIVSRLSVEAGIGGTVAAYLTGEGGTGSEMTFRNIFDLAEEIVAEMRKNEPEFCDAETAYIQAFMDHVIDWTGKNGNNLAAFLRDWRDSDPKVAAPESGDAVRVMTVHKSKGLEFPVVILPFVEKINFFRPASKWCRPRGTAAKLTAGVGAEFNVPLSDTSKDTYFRDDYLSERAMQGIDAANIMYVAMTRAKAVLEVIAALPAKTVRENFDKGNFSAARNMSHILYSYVRNEDYEVGEPYDFSAAPRRGKKDSTMEISTYACGGSASRRRVVVHSDSKEYFLGKETADETGQVPETGVLFPDF